MKIENIQRVESLIKERNAIVEFRDEIATANNGTKLTFEDILFKSDFLRPIYGTEFISEIRSSVQNLCDSYINKIDTELTTL